MGLPPARTPKERHIAVWRLSAGHLAKGGRAPMRRNSLDNDLRFLALGRDQQLVWAFDFVFGL
jgi:hypothetical protein